MRWYSSGEVLGPEVPASKPLMSLLKMLPKRFPGGTESFEPFSLADAELIPTLVAAAAIPPILNHSLRVGFIS
jgi:hypothetical protein